MVKQGCALGGIRLTWDGGRSSLWQYTGALVAFLYFIHLGHGNNGLWYQGDSSVHATNGLFWSDLLYALPRDPVRFALSYYARFPAISPIAYPPFFYLLEAAAYHIFGPSPFVGKALVMGFSLLGTMYLISWARRWISPEAGWFGILFLFQPGIETWGHALMLNAPCTALAVAALYHWRGWLEDPTGSGIWYAVGYATLSVFTYIPTVVVAIVMVSWALAAGKFRVLLDRRMVMCACLIAVPLLVWTHIQGRWDEGYRQAALYLGGYPAWKFAAWTFYLYRAPELASIPVLLMAGAGLVVGWWRLSWRSEAVIAATWIAICYMWFSLFAVKEPRYALLLIPPLLILSAVALTECVRFVRAFGPVEPSAALVAGILVMLLWQGFSASTVRLPVVSGFSPIAAYLHARDPDAWIFYDGHYGELFTYYYRLQDPDFHGGVVRADKLLYAANIDPKFGLVENVSSVADVTRLLRNDCGCRYFVVERTSSPIAAERYLHTALRSHDFHLLGSFFVDTRRTQIIDVYQYTGPLSRPIDLTFRFPVVRDGARFTIKPIDKR